MILTVDIGGTKTLCTFWDGHRRLEKKKYATRAISDFSVFLADQVRGKDISALCIAAAGPFSGGRVQLTNTGQSIDSAQLRERLPSIPRIAVLNDLEALGYSILHLPSGKIPFFKEGKPSCGTAAILSLGTGLGVSAVTKEGIVLSSEGGHMDFAPEDAKQEQVLRFLRRQYGHVSYERVLSGQGLANIDAAFLKPGARPRSPEQITSAALEKEPEALTSIHIFTCILAAFAGNLALTFKASAGVYLGGGMVPKIFSLLDSDLFCQVFTAKGRFQAFLEAVPVRVILDEEAPSLGAASYVQRLTTGGCRP